MISGQMYLKLTVEFKLLLTSLVADNLTRTSLEGLIQSVKAAIGRNPDMWFSESRMR